VPRQNNHARDWIAQLRLEPHPEGGYYRQTYRSDLILPQDALPPGFAGPRAASTAIYFLLEGQNFSAFHRLQSDELWHFYAGSPLAVHVINPDGQCHSIHLGSDPHDGQVLQAVVPAGWWFASEVADGISWALVGCTVSPGFDFADFELAQSEELTRQYPQHAALICRLTCA